ncbi:hypothetical protein [Maioricimonas sp. JC845]|uniref:hypothetical protein n=1 Tax=Maioricimonas sp. JC845 TaxID=3232138 RepID=UPI003459561D
MTQVIREGKEEPMAGKGNAGPRKPATKLPHLQKKQLKQIQPQGDSLRKVRKGASESGGAGGGGRGH